MRSRSIWAPAVAAWLLLFPAVQVLGASFSIRDHQGMPCLWQNGLPYFGRFADTDRQVLNLAGEWRFQVDPRNTGEAEGFNTPGHDDRDWRLLPVPGVWNTRDSELSHYNGIAWYRRTFTAPDPLPTGLARIYLDGVAIHGRVWLNGALLGEHSGGYTAWSLDAGKAIHPGKNWIAIRVDNRRGYTDVPPKLWEGEKLGWWPYGGIARPCLLEFAPAVSINKLVITAEPLAKGYGRVTVSGLVYNHRSDDVEAVVHAVAPSRGKFTPADLGSVRVTVPAGDCARFEFPWGVMTNVLHWSNTETSRYTMEVMVEAGGGADRVADWFGFRTFEVHDGGIFLNGKPYWMRGLNRHEDDPQTGLYQSDRSMDEDMDLLRELRVNHMRPAHYPNDPRWLDRCDREGITITEEIPLYQAASGPMKWVESKIMKGRKDDTSKLGGGYPTLQQMNDPLLIQNARQQLIEMIERDRNHPCVIMWSVGNENFTYLKRARKMYEELIAVCRKFDPGRPVTFALLSGPGVSPLLEQTADLADVIFINEYYGWYFGKASGVGGLLDRFHKKYPDKPIVVSEFGAGAVYGRHENPPEKFSEEYQVEVYETQFRQIRERPFIVGTIPWAMADFRCPWFLEEHPVFEMNLKGLVDYERHQKAAFQTVSRIYREIEEAGVR